ncbi:MAG TPA: DUF4190 domain-containing protein [Phycisphaerales bacterium]|nr:DUF4190 domain-containing protein [Phycisphaerales bacterium]HRQ74968.1 DUF4190 domain-containing protein [Phycisphaerales bacterium]
MSQFGNPYYAEFDETQQKTSRMAISSLVCSLICCIPITTILGAVLGAFALVRISSNPALRGKGFAVAGLILGISFTAVQGWLVYSFSTTFEMFKAAPYQALEPGFRGDYASMRAFFGPNGMSATDADAQAFIEALRSRYGELIESTIHFENFRGMAQPTPGDPEVTMPWVLVFDRGEVRAQLTFREQDQVRSAGSIVFYSITVVDSTDGNLTFPPATP